jgi:serine/threonine protein kinase
MENIQKESMMQELSNIWQDLMGDYEILQILGKGAHGTVVKAQDKSS